MRPLGWLRRSSPSRLLVVGLVFLVTMAPTVIVIEALVRARLTDQMFRPPTRYLARPTVLYPGMRVDGKRFEGQLQRLGYRQTRRAVRIGEYSRRSGSWTVGRRSFRHGDGLEPAQVVTLRLDYDARIRSLRDPRNRSLRFVALEPEILWTYAGKDAVDRVPVALNEMPDEVIRAVLTIEDQRFFEHKGVDLRRVAGALIANIRAGRVTQGASTVTQQLAKNLFLSPRRTPLRKARELAMALTLERRHTKEEILEAYLNHVYLGQDGVLAIRGVGRAAQFYFAKDVTQLGLSEAALLAGIIRGPSMYAPFRHPERAQERRALVLNLMEQRDVISREDHDRATAAGLGLVPGAQRVRTGRYFVDYVTRDLTDAHGKKALDQGLSVFTTLDVDLQLLAESAVRDGLTRLERAHSRLRTQNEPLQAALVALDPRTGEILAMTGGRDYGTSQFNRAVYARRQPGSAFKPIVALTALARGGRYTLATQLEDNPLRVETPAGLWQPTNYDGRFRGKVTMREALERSLNVPFARLGIDIGPEHIVETAQRLGITGPLSPVPSLALGAGEVTPLELTRAYGMFAAEGYLARPHATLRVVDTDGEELSRFEFRGERLYGAAEAYLITSALQGAVQRGTGRALSSFGYRGPVAAKSGTTNDFRDAWFMGYTPTLVVGVWVGFDDGRPLGLPGSGAALPIFARFLVGAVGTRGDLDFQIPSGIEVVEVDHDTGLRAGPGCRGEPEVFIRGTAPEESCSPYWASDRRYRSNRDRTGRELAHLLEELLRRLGRN